MAIGTITINGYRFYNGGWSDSYRSLASSYSKSGSYCTVDRIVLPSFNSSQYSSYTINYRISLITAGGTNSGTLYGYLCSSDPASGSPSQAPHISYIGYGSIDYSGLNQNHKYFTIPITINNSLTSGGTYYLWLQTSDIAQLHYKGQVSATLDGTELDKYQIQYYTNYPDSTSQTKFETTTHTAGTVATLTSSIPTKTGYIFKGWSKSSSAKLPSYYSKRPSGDISSATSLYAVWWPNFDWVNYNYSEWQTFVTNCNNYLSTSLTSPDIYFKASDVNVLRTAFSLSSIAANTLITKTPLDELEAEWDKINGGY